MVPGSNPASYLKFLTWVNGFDANGDFNSNGANTFASYILQYDSVGNWVGSSLCGNDTTLVRDLFSRLTFTAV